MALLAGLALVGLLSPVHSAASTIDAGGIEPDAPDQKRAALIEKLIPIQASLRGAYADAFGGLWVDDAGFAHFAFTSLDSKASAFVLGSEVDQPTFELVAFTERDLDAAMKGVIGKIEVGPSGLQLAGVDVKSVVLSLPRNAVIVSSDVEADKAAVLEDSLPPGVVIERGGDSFRAMCSSRSNCGSPLRAGIQLYKNTSGATACMSAFVLKDVYLPPHYFLTSAGHCWDANSLNRYHPSSALIGSTNGQYHPVTTPVDSMRFPIAASQASNLVYVTSSLSRSVTATEWMSSEVIGEQVCSSKLSGVDCGYLQSNNVCTEYGVCNQRLASYQYTCPGDSGSPVYVVTGSGNAKAMGIMVAGTAGTFACPNVQYSSGHQGVYTHIENAMGALGATVVVSAP